jgi:ApaG protein
MAHETDNVLALSQHFSVSVQPSFLPEQSDPVNYKFVWSYEITIKNNHQEIVQLLGRFWRITDMSGRVEEVHGPGVVGLQPIIKPDKEFIYKSYCQLTTPQGTMEGYYEMQNLEEQHFHIEIPKFILSAPSSITRVFKSKLH